MTRYFSSDELADVHRMADRVHADGYHDAARALDDLADAYVWRYGDGWKRASRADEQRDHALVALRDEWTRPDDLGDRGRHALRVAWPDIYEKLEMLGDLEVGAGGRRPVTVEQVETAAYALCAGDSCGWTPKPCLIHRYEAQVALDAVARMSTPTTPPTIALEDQ